MNFSFHTMLYKTLLCFISPHQRLGYIETHNWFRKTSDEMKIHFRPFRSKKIMLCFR